MSERMLARGEWAPGFTLKDQGGKEVSLSGYRGKKVVLAFHPLAWTPICTTQMQDLEKHVDALASRGAVGLGLSVDSAPCKAAWAQAIGVEKTRLLSDFWPHGGVAQTYGLFRYEQGFSERAVVIVGPGGAVEWTRLYRISRVPDFGEILTALDGIEG